MTNVYTAARLRKGLPVPMKCTYNGMAVINAAPFQLHNLRFRWESLPGLTSQQREGLLGLRTCGDALWPALPVVCLAGCISILCPFSGHTACRSSARVCW